MTSRSVQSGLAFGAALALGLSVAAPATAVAPDAHVPSSHVERHAAATTTAEQRHVKEYWTPQRMLSAVPGGTQEDTQQATGDAAQGPPAGTAVQQAADPRSGKVFFTLGGLNYVCSGTATESANGDVVTTAGHCVNDGAGAYVTNFAFVPAYENHVAPYGIYTAKALFTTSQWADSADYDYDVGFAVMNDAIPDLVSLTDSVGGYPITFDRPSTETYEVHGYPASAPFDGETLWTCSGAADETYAGSKDLGLDCDMNGGASGGGWITNGKLNSVSSFISAARPGVVFGPQFGASIEAAYQAAQSAN